MLRKYLGKVKRTIFGGRKKIDINAYSLDFEDNDVSAHAYAVAEDIRGKNRKPSIIIHGIMQRSGTVYTGELLRLHPDLQAYPNEIWEFPFLQLTGTFKSSHEQFFQAYRQNKGKIGKDDFLPLFGSSVVAYLYSYLPSDKRLLIKVPDVSYLNNFKSVFPFENLLLLMRDGRDVVSSTIRTWPEKNFRDVCKRWDLSTRMALKYSDLYGGEKSGFWLARYEDAVNDPIAFVNEACKYLDLDVSRYPFDKMDEIRVIGSSSQKKDGKVTWEGEAKPKNFNALGRWKDWSQRDKNTFKKIAGESLIKAGYCENLDW
jgi:hypothetical protein